MANKVHWHRVAIEDFFEIIAYFENEGFIQAAENFRETVQTKIAFISKYPGAGRPTSRRKNVKYILVDKHRRMYYRFQKNSISILAFSTPANTPIKVLFKQKKSGSRRRRTRFKN